MSKREIAFKGSFSNGAEHTDYLTIHDNYQGTRRAAVVVDKHAMYSPADIDALIAALRSARDALAGDAGRPRDDGAVTLIGGVPLTQDIPFTPGGYDSAPDAMLTFVYDDDPPPAPSRATDAAPERETRSAATVRLTRAQREALEALAQDGYYMGRPGMRDQYSVYFITNGRGGDHLRVRSATVTVLYKAKLIATTGDFDSYRITQRGRDALTAGGNR